MCALCAESPKNESVRYAVQGLLTKHLQSAHGVPRKAAANMARAAAPTVQTTESPDKTEEVAVADNSGCSNSVTEPVRRLFVSGEVARFQCSRCDFSVEDRAEFVVHAGKHGAALVGAVQCMECAGSFTIASALYRHLRIVHRIDCNIDTYLRENGGAPRCTTPDAWTTDDEPASPELSSYSLPASSGGHSAKSTASVGEAAAPGKDNAGEDDDAPAECNVCYRVFLSKQSLRAHMRVHGMVFIQRTRRRLPTSPPTAAESPN